MCNRIILDMYICESCYDELVEFKNRWEPPMTAQMMQAKIKQFMETEPGTHGQVVDIEAEFESLTNKLRY